MRMFLAASIWLLVAVVHTPTNAQAVVYSFFPDFLTLGSHEPASLFLTGVALLSLPALRRRGSRAATRARLASPTILTERAPLRVRVA